MNKTERSTLAAIAAERMYGESANAQSASFAKQLLRAFPTIQEEFKSLADIAAADRVARLMVEALANPLTSVGAEGRAEWSALFNTADEVAMEFDDWCSDTGRSPADLVDKGADIRELLGKADFLQHMIAAAQRNPALQLFVDRMLPVRADT